MSDFYYSDRNDPPTPQDQETITPGAWGGFVSVVEKALKDGSLARAFPLRDCQRQHGPGDGPITGVDRPMLFGAVRAHIPRLPLALHSRLAYRLHPDQVPDTSAALDLIEFIGPHIHRPDNTNGSCHWDGVDVHYNFAEFTLQDPDDLFFDEQPRLPPGQEEYRQAVERIFRRQGLAFTLDREMKVQRLAPPETRPVLSDFRPQTGDQALDGLLTEATTRFLAPDPQERIRALEKLWDAYERAKTLYHPGMDKKASLNRLLRESSSGSEEAFQRLDQDFRTLTDIGNQFRIRHHEMGKHELPSSEFVDYLFTRMVSALALILRKSGFMGA